LAKSRKSTTSRNSAPAKSAPAGRNGRCRYCRASIRPDNNFCAHCGMPTDPERDQPLFVVEGLTNLFNFVFFESLLEHELNRASRYGHDLSVLVVEVDTLNELEAGYGYEETNRILRFVGELISHAIREPDTIAATNRVAALGTQRFLVLLPETNEEGAFRTAEKIRTMIDSTPLNLTDGQAGVTVSLGVASSAGLEQGGEANLLMRATQALIESHGRGANRVQVATS
jgi:diguanylate cyclase (GGDEF)-like protein